MILIHKQSTLCSRTRTYNPDVCDSEGYHNLRDFHVAYQNGDYRLAAYKLGYGLHYVQDTCSPPHVCKYTGEQTHRSQYAPYSDKEVHGQYETCTNWNQFDINYEDFIATSKYQGFVTVYVNQLKPVVDNILGNTVGTAAWKNTNMRNYMKNRFDAWFNNFKKIASDPSHAAEHKAATRNSLLWDLGIAANIELRYMKADSFKVYLANPSV